MAKRKPFLPDYGTVQIKGKTYFRTRLSDDDGNRISLYADSREELYKKVVEVEKQIENKTFRRSTPTVREYCEKWLLMKSANVRETTMIDYRSKVKNHIIKPLGDMKMGDVTADDIRLAIIPASKLSSSVFKSVNVLYKCIFHSALESKVIDKDPTIYLSPEGGGVPQKDRIPLTDEQVEKLLQATKGLPPYLFVMLGLYAGLRREEILALKWDSVYLELDAPYLTVCRAWHTENVAVGNVPFGDFKVLDKRYDKHHWLIHDYFFGKTLDKVRLGGIVAFITSKGTLDKENSSVRKYLAQRADLIGAIRLPDNTFKRNAGTEVTSDIIFLQKRDHITDLDQDWVHLDTDENGIRMNRYFVQHPEMILGDMVMESTRFGPDSACKAREGEDLSEQLANAIQFLQAEIKPYELEELDEEEDRSIPADPTVKNFSYTIADGQVYYRENSLMHPVEVSVTAENRIRGMIELRECTRRLIEYQTEGYPDEDIAAEQQKLNALYDSFTAKYGLLNSRGNKLAFSEDSSYCLLCSLEVLDEQGNLKRKADMFTRRTIRPHVAVTSVDTASEALAVSISEKARVDMDYMAELSGKSPEELEKELAGVIYRDIRCAENPEDILPSLADLSRYPLVTADEYLSGKVRQKLRMAKAFLEVAPDNQKETARRNVEALEAVQPQDLGAGEIGVRIGANWVPIEVYQQFMVELLTPNYYVRDRIKILRSEATGQWSIREKNADRSNVKAITTYGTKRMSAYHILEQTLNQRDVRVFDYIEDENGKKKPVLNKKETAIAQDRQELIKQKFAEWIWKDIDRRELLCRVYNETFNGVRPREYDGRHIRFEGMNPEISLRPHQINAIAHILYGGNTLLAHEVGAGKSATRS